jgi:hypothetical protein
MDDGQRRRIRAEIDRLAETIGHSGLPADDGRVVAWAAERGRLYDRLAGTADDERARVTTMKGRLIIGYEHEDAFEKRYSNHTARLHFELEISEEGITKLGELEPHVEKLQKFCERKVLEAIERTRPTGAAGPAAGGDFDPNAAADEEAYARAEGLPLPQRQARAGGAAPQRQARRESFGPDDHYDTRDEPIRDDRRRYDGRGGGGGRGGANSGPPRNARQLAGWAKSHQCVRWFEDFGQGQGWGKWLSDWADDDALWAYDEYLKKDGPAGARTSGERQYSNGRRS